MLRQAIIIFIVVLLAFAASAKLNLETGIAPPAFKLSSLSGQTINLENLLGKNVLVLSFFASWSESCRSELNFLTELDEKYSAGKLKIIGVSFDRKEEELRAYLTDHKINFEVLHDKKITTLKDFRILILPTLFIIDQTGKIINIYVDFDENVEKAVEAKLAKLTRT